MDRFDEMRGKNGSGGGNTGGFPIIIPPEAGELTGIVISNLPKRVDYSEGDSLDMTGLEVTATYDNGVVGIVTGACEIVVDDPLTSNTKSVIVKYQEFEASFLINVYAKLLPIPSSALYLLHFNDNVKNALDSNENVISSSPSFSTGKFGKACNSVGSLSSTFNKLASIETIITKGGYDFTFSFWIKFSSTYSAYDHQFGWGDDGRYDDYGLWLDLRTDTKLRLSVSSSKYIDYITETSMLNTWLHVAFTIDKDVNTTLFINGKKIGTQNFRMSGVGITQSKQKTIFWRMPIDELLITNDILYTSDFKPPANEYGGEKVLQKIYLAKSPSKTIYKSGEYFSLEGAVINAVFSDGTILDVTNECTIGNGNALTVSDTCELITYTYQGIKKQLYINVGVYTTPENIDLLSAKLLLPFDGITVDTTGLNTVNVVGNGLYSKGKFGLAKYFNGTDEYVSMPYTNELKINTGDFTIACWFKIAIKDTSDGHIIFSASKTNTALRAGVDANLNVFCNVPNTSGTLIIGTISGYTTPLGEWIHFALVRKGNVFTCYINGKNYSTANYDGEILTNTSKFYIGARANSGETGVEWVMTGSIDDFIITKSALWDSDFEPPALPLYNM